MGYSIYKNRVIEFVKNNPGCCKLDIATHCTKSIRANPSKQYYIVNTAIRNGWIMAKWSGNRYIISLPIVSTERK